MLINQYGQELDPYAPLGNCDICGAAAWTTGIYGVLCPSHEYIANEHSTEEEYRPLPFVDELVDALEDVGFIAQVQYPYVIVSLKNRSITPSEVALALDIDPALCCYNINGNIRITCD